VSDGWVTAWESKALNRKVRKEEPAKDAKKGSCFLPVP
jgi:hypothetical protein